MDYGNSIITNKLKERQILCQNNKENQLKEFSREFFGCWNCFFVCFAIIGGICLFIGAAVFFAKPISIPTSWSVIFGIFGYIAFFFGFEFAGLIGSRNSVFYDSYAQSAMEILSNDKEEIIELLEKRIKRSLKASEFVSNFAALISAGVALYKVLAPGTDNKLILLCALALFVLAQTLMVVKTICEAYFLPKLKA